MGYSLGEKSREHLKGVHPNLVKVVERAIELTEQDFIVFEGLRTLATQQAYLKRGVTRTLKSMHLPQPDGLGHAVDLVPWVAGGPRWEWPPIFQIAVAVDQAATELKVPLTWGGVWDRRMDQYGGSAASMKAAVDEYCRRHPGPDFIDGPHYQLA